MKYTVLTLYPIVDSSIKSEGNGNYFSLQNETVSDTLLDKFNNLSANNTMNDRIIRRVIIEKDVIRTSAMGGLMNEKGGSDYTLGISIIQGPDNHVYVKDLVVNGPGARNGIQIGDQVCNMHFFLDQKI